MTAKKKLSSLRLSLPVSERYSKTSAITLPEAIAAIARVVTPFRSALLLSRLGKKRKHQAKNHRRKQNDSKMTFEPFIWSWTRALRAPPLTRRLRRGGLKPG